MGSASIESRFKQLNNATARLLSSVFAKSGEETLDDAAAAILSLSESDSASIFTFHTKDSEKILRLRGTAQRHSVASQRRTVELPLQDETSLTVYFSKLEETTVVKSVASLKGIGRAAEHLPAPRKSAMGKMIRGRKGNPIAVLKVESIAGTPAYTSADVEIFDQFVLYLLPILQRLDSFDVMRRVTDITSQSAHTKELLNRICDCCIELTDADWATISIVDQRTSNLIVRAGRISGFKKRVVTPTFPCEQAAGDLASRALVKGQSEYQVKNARLGQSISVHFPETQTGAASRMELNDFCLGVLTVGSSQKHGFDSEDRKNLDLFSRHAAQVTFASEYQRVLRTATQMTFGTPQPFPQSLSPLLEAIAEALGFDEGLIYVKDHANGHDILRPTLYRGAPEIEERTRKFHYKLTDTSLAVHVYNEGRPYFSPDPWKDPLVNKEGLEEFAIKTPIAGVPLVSNEAKLGCLVVWSRRGSFVRETDLDFLRPFADLISAKISLVVTEHRLVRSQGLYRTLIDQLPVAVFLKYFAEGLQSPGKFVFVNGVQAEMLGQATADEVNGNGDDKFFSEADAITFFTRDVSILRSGEDGQWDEIFAPIGQPERRVMTRKVPIYIPSADSHLAADDVQPPNHILGILWELTDEDYRISVRTDGVIDDIDNRGLAALGYRDKRDVVGLMLQDIVNQSDHWKLIKLFSQREFSPAQLVAFNALTDEGPRHSWLMQRVGAYPQEAWECLQISCRDYTEQARREERTRAKYWSLALPGLLAVGLAHHLNRSVADIAKGRERLSWECERLLPTPNELDTHLATIDRGISAARELWGQLARLSMDKDASALRRSLSFEPINPVNLKGRIRDSVEEEVRHRKVGVRFLSDSSTKMIHGHGGLLTVALIEIVRNAVRHSRPDTAVEVTMVHGEAFAEIMVRDYGVGIGAEELARAWEPFFTTDAGGTGTGLPLAKAIVEDLHRGKIWIERANPGTIVKIQLNNQEQT